MPDSQAGRQRRQRDRSSRGRSPLDTELRSTVCGQKPETRSPISSCGEMKDGNLRCWGRRPGSIRLPLLARLGYHASPLQPTNLSAAAVLSTRGARAFSACMPQPGRAIRRESELHASPLPPLLPAPSAVPRRRAQASWPSTRDTPGRGSNWIVQPAGPPKPVSPSCSARGGPLLRPLC